MVLSKSTLLLLLLQIDKLDIEATIKIVSCFNRVEIKTDDQITAVHEDTLRNISRIKMYFESKVFLFLVSTNNDLYINRSQKHQ